MPADENTETSTALERAGLDAERVAEVIGEERIELTPYEFPRPWMRAFVAVLARTGEISSACRGAQINKTSAYDARRNHPVFAEAWAEALSVSVDLLEQIAIRRATMGEEEVETTTTRSTNPDGGVTESTVTRTRQKRSDTLLMFMLRARRPADFRERVDHRHAGADGGPVRVEVYRYPDEERVRALAAMIAADREHPDVDGTVSTNGDHPPDA